MGSNNGIIRIGRKGIKKFAFGEEGKPFEVEIVTTFQEWVGIDQGFRDENRIVPNEQMSAYHQAAVEFVTELSKGQDVTVAEALDFLARLREQYDELADFFQPKPRSLAKPDLPDTTVSELQFSVEDNSASSTK